jgi:c-di-GMP-binding flagellar brake protein YcgR
MNTRKGHQLFLETGRTHAHAKFHGVEMTFTCKLIEVFKDNDASVYKIRFPEVVNYHQRRSYFRAVLPVESMLPVSIELPGHGILSGRLLDISLGGLKIEISSTGMIECERGQPVNSCRFELDSRELEIEGMVRNISKTPRGGCNLGIMFIGQTPAQIRIIEAFVAHQQREQIKRIRQSV